MQITDYRSDSTQCRVHFAYKLSMIGECMTVEFVYWYWIFFSNKLEGYMSFGGVSARFGCRVGQCAFFMIYVQAI